MKLLTQWWSDHAPQNVKDTEIPKYYAAILKDSDAVALKLLDQADNLTDMANTISISPNWAERYLKKTLDEMPPLIASSRNLDAVEFCLAAIEKLKAAVHRYREGASKSHLSQRSQFRNF